MPPRHLKRSLRGFQPYAPGRQPPDGEDWVKLNTNEAPWPPSPRVQEALRQAVGESLRLYPSPTAAPARQAMARAHGLEAAQVALGNGGDELIEMCFRAFAGAGDRVAFPTPTYPLLEPLCAVHEAEPARHPLGPGWALPEDFARDPAPLKFLVNPNSPTGSWLDRDAVRRVVELSEGVVVLDEAYVDFAPSSRLDLLAGHGNLVLLRTLSKSHALAGMRIGFALAHPDLIQSLDLVKDSYNLDRLAIVAAVAAMEDLGYRDRLVGYVREERAWLAGRLRDLGFEVPRSEANFLFVRPTAGVDPNALFAGLMERRVLVRRYDQEPIAGWLRVTIGTRQQHERLLAALEETMA
jgi:histidinol-phosphate aminotransferase